MNRLPPIFRTFVVVAFAALMGASPCNAADSVQWRETRIVSEILPGQTTEVEFSFVNKGDVPVGFHKVETDCRCTTPEYAPEETIPPGGTGRLKVRFVPEGRSGNLTKRIWVSMTDNPENTFELHWEINILPVLSFSPDVLEVEWPPGEKAVPKIITVKKIRDVPVSILAVESTSRNFGAEVDQTREDQGVWTITVWPEFPEEENEGIVFIRSSFPPGFPRTFYLIAKVAKPKI